ITAWSTAFLGSVPIADRLPVVGRVFKRFPFFYLPVFVYPMKEEGRATGLLIPAFNISPSRGVDLEPAFFWAMGRSMDQTFSYQNRPKLSARIGHEFRYVRADGANGTFSTYIFPAQDPLPEGVTQDPSLPEPNKGREYDLHWRAVQPLPFGFRAQLRLDQYSSQNSIQGNFARISGPMSRDGSLVVRRELKIGSFQFAAVSSDILRARRTEIRRTLPSFNLLGNPYRLGKTGLLWKYELRADRVELGNLYKAEFEESFGPSWQDRFTRYDVLTEVSRPYALTYLTLRPRLIGRYTRYSATTESGTGRVRGPRLARQFGEGLIEMNGPNFSRVFASPFKFYTDKFKHVIGPFATWRFRSNIGRAGEIPQFDPVDNQFGTNELQYGLMQTLWSRRPGPSRKMAPYQMMTWMISQSYYFNLADSDKRYDPNYATIVLGPGNVAAHRSPIQSNLRFDPSREVSVRWTLQYDVNYKQLFRQDITSNFYGRWGRLGGRWSRFVMLNTDPTLRTRRETFSGDTTLNLVPKRLTLNGNVYYDANQKVIQNYLLQGQVNVQCFGLMLNVNKTRYGTTYRSSIGFAVELGGLGSIGLGAGGTGGMNMLGSNR
ncbi:MAG: LPS assembly protein LptD, partial [Vicinamibacteria bacterium]|nr:LPS assembly protein LptD [Vicinamibacteria bacterium]